jgi:hypothetical protein
MRTIRNPVLSPTVFLGVIQILVVAVLALPVLAGAQSTHPTFRSEFRYVILTDDVETIARKYRTRGVRVLMDDKAFSEENLTKLFNLLLKRYPEPDWMVVSVMTSLEQVATPEEVDREIIMSHTNNHPEYDLYNNAVLIRQGENEFFRYTINPPRTEMKTVVLKGCDPATSKCPQ